MKFTLLAIVKNKAVLQFTYNLNRVTKISDFTNFTIFIYSDFKIRNST